MMWVCRVVANDSKVNKIAATVGNLDKHSGFNPHRKVIYV